MQTVVGPELLVDVPQLAAGISQEHPSCDAVVEGAQVQKEQQDRAGDDPTVAIKQDTFERCQECQFTGHPGHDQERRQGSASSGCQKDGHH